MVYSYAYVNVLCTNSFVISSPIMFFFFLSGSLWIFNFLLIACCSIHTYHTIPYHTHNTFTSIYVIFNETKKTFMPNLTIPCIVYYALFVLSHRFLSLHLHLFLFFFYFFLFLLSNRLNRFEQILFCFNCCSICFLSHRKVIIEIQSIQSIQSILI